MLYKIKDTLKFIVMIMTIIPLSFSHVASSQVPRIRGISIADNSLYPDISEFQCFDGSRKITFDKINDDYCDCTDGSDEPGTAACSNGSFFCQNSEYKSKYIPSGRVNDGICDCCDGSDEYKSGNHCTNICYELGKVANAEAEKAVELSREGNKKRLEMVTQGKKLRDEYVLKLTKLRSDYDEAEFVKKEKEMLKNEIENREKIALEKYKSELPEPIEAVNNNTDNQTQEQEAEQYFKLLDKDESGTVTLYEIQNHKELDKDGNGAVTEEEAMYFLGHQDEVNYQEFFEKAWINIKPFLMKKQESFKPPANTNTDTNNLSEELAKEADNDAYNNADEDFAASDDEADDEPEDDAEHEHEAEHDENHEYRDDENQEQKQVEVEYDEETQSIIDEANTARVQYNQAEKSLLDLQNEIRTLEGKVERDYGKDDVFATLDGQCFQHTNFEYIYSMCMYGRTTQSAKSGGSEVLLGHWQEWTGNAINNNKYSQMKFGGGATCWNGPTRSAVIDLRCGLENQLTSVSEPRRCEYIMTFETPAVCNPIDNLNDTHDEL